MHILSYFAHFCTFLATVIGRFWSLLVISVFCASFFWRILTTFAGNDHSNGWEMGVLWVWLSVTGLHMGVAFCGDAALLHDETEDNQLVFQPRLSPAQQAIRATTRRDLAASRTCAKWAQINDNVSAVGIGPHRRSNRVGKRENISTVNKNCVL